MKPQGLPNPITQSSIRYSPRLRNYSTQFPYKDCSLLSSGNHLESEESSFNDIVGLIIMSRLSNCGRLCCVVAVNVC